jgi:hypothetical protein
VLAEAASEAAGFAATAGLLTFAFEAAEAGVGLVVAVSDEVSGLLLARSAPRSLARAFALALDA